MSGVPFALAFGAGLVASVNPCGFALLPSLLAFQLGTEARGGTRAARVADGLVAGLVLTAGFMLVFGAAGAVFALGGGAIVAAVPWITVAVGVGLVGLGAWLLSGRYLAVPLPGLRAPGTRGNRSLFLFGAAYAVGSLSCTLPVFLLVVGSALATGSLLGTIGVFLAYALGMSTVLMVLCLGTAGVRELVFRRVRRLSPHLQRITGTLLLLGGGYVVAYWLSLLRGGGQGPALALVQDVQRFAQDLVLRIGQGWWMALGVLLLAGAVSALAARRGVGAAGPEEDPEGGEGAEADGAPWPGDAARRPRARPGGTLGDLEAPRPRALGGRAGDVRPDRPGGGAAREGGRGTARAGVQPPAERASAIAMTHGPSTDPRPSHPGRRRPP